MYLLSLCNKLNDINIDKLHTKQLCMESTIIDNKSACIKEDYTI